MEGAVGLTGTVLAELSVAGPGCSLLSKTWSWDRKKMGGLFMERASLGLRKGWIRREGSWGQVGPTDSQTRLVLGRTPG